MQSMESSYVSSPEEMVRKRTLPPPKSLPTDVPRLKELERTIQIEFRYCMAVNVIAFVYSGFQGYDLIYQLTSGERKVCQWRNDILLQATIMVMMISVKRFYEHGGEMQVAQDAPLKPSMDIFAVGYANGGMLSYYKLLLWC